MVAEEEEEATGVSFILVCLMKPCSACMEVRGTPWGTRVLEAPRGIGCTLSLCHLSPCLLCQAREERAYSPLLYPQRSP